MPCWKYIVLKFVGEDRSDGGFLLDLSILAVSSSRSSLWFDLKGQGSTFLLNLSLLTVFF